MCAPGAARPNTAALKLSEQRLLIRDFDAMRSLLSWILLVLALLSPAYAEENQRKLTVEDVLSETRGGPKDAGAAAGATNSEAVSDEATTFNGVKVPPMKELNGNDFDKDTKDGYWYVVTTGLSHRP